MLSKIVFRCHSTPLLLQRHNIQCNGIIDRFCRSFKTSSNLRLCNPKETSKTGAVNALRRGPASWKTFFLSAFGGIILGTSTYYIYQHRINESKKLKVSPVTKVGTPLVGGEWTLVDYDGNVVSHKDYLGKWLLMYFGFTHCPDICPEELEKLCQVVEKLNKDPRFPGVTPLFITVDPSRDTAEKLKKYCNEYSPGLLGLTGTNEQVRAVCKTFRIYFGSGSMDSDGDYIVDHTVVTYLIDPSGKYVDHYTRDKDADKMESEIRKRVKYYKKS